MAYAPFSMSRPPVGQFKSSESGELFEYALHTDDGWLSSEEFPHQIFVNDHRGGIDTRHAMIKKTVAYIVVDEAADGTPVVERWPIKSHRQYAITN